VAASLARPCKRTLGRPGLPTGAPFISVTTMTNAAMHSPRYVSSASRLAQGHGGVLESAGLASTVFKVEEAANVVD